jgi:acetyl-CoA C-acetyltransferase
MSNDPVVIVSAQRTPIGSFQGVFSSVTAPLLGAAAIQGAVSAAGIAPEVVSDVIMGCVLPAGLGQAPARQAALAGGLPQSVPTTTINKMCGSAMKAVMMACDALLAHQAEVVVAGGLESMTNAPYLLPKARSGYRMGHGEVLDHMFLDGLQSPWDKQMMGCFAENTADKYQLSREAQDAFATHSVQKSLKAIETGAFKNEIVPVTVKGRKGDTVVTQDETPFACDIAKIAGMKPAFRKDGTVTAASSSSISDGAAALVLMRQSTAHALGLKPLARVVAYKSHAHEPEWFTTAPVGAIAKTLKAAGWSANDVDLWEINEAFATVTMSAVIEHHLDMNKVNVHGGACALGHPIGATGARILATLVHALFTHQQQRGLATLCIGGGEATAVAIERL